MKLNAGTYSYMNSMRHDKSAKKSISVALQPMQTPPLTSTSTAQAEKPSLPQIISDDREKQLRIIARKKWKAAYCATKFIMLHKRVASMNTHSIEKESNKLPEVKSEENVDDIEQS